MGKMQMRKLLVTVQEDLKISCSWVKVAVLPNNIKATNMVAKGTTILSTSVTVIHGTIVLHLFHL
jgi:hypothetical protein